MANMLERSVAKVQFEWLSRALVRHPKIGKLIVDNVEEWLVTDTPADSIANWQMAPGCPKSGLLPRHYASRLIMSTNRMGLDQQAFDLGGEPAAAFKFGKNTVVATPVPFAERDGEGALIGAEHLEVIFGVGKNACEATVGVHIAEGNSFVSARGDVQSTIMVASLQETLAAYPDAFAV